jgi:hypothetical protein
MVDPDSPKISFQLSGFILGLRAVRRGILFQLPGLDFQLNMPKVGPMRANWQILNIARRYSKC